MLIQAIRNFKFNSIDKKPSNNLHGLHLTTLTEDKFEKSISFKGFPCAQDRFELKYFEDIPCPSCGKPMIQNSEVREFVDDVSNKTGQELIEALHKYDDLYRPIEAQVVKEIAKMAEKFPEDDLSALVKLAAVKNQTHLVKEQIKILKRIEGLGANLQKSERIELSKNVQAAIRFAKMTGNDDDDHFARKKFLAELYILTENFSNDKIVKEIRKAAQLLPSSTSSLSAFFVKYSRESSEKIAARLLTPMTVTTEHIKPQSFGGEDDTANYLVECADCNSKRGNMPYNEWFKIQPRMPENLQRYLDAVDMAIKKHEPQGYRNYVRDIIKTIRQETKGRIELEDPNEVEALKEELKDPTQLRKERIEKIEKRIEKDQERLRELDKTLEGFIEDEEYQSVLKYILLQEREEETKTNKVNTSKRLTEVKHEIHAQEKRKEKLAQLESTLSQPKDKLSRKGEEDLRGKISRLREKIEKDIDLTPTLLEAQENYTQAVREYNDAKLEFEEFRKTFKLAEDYMEEEEALQAQIKTRKEIEKEIRVYDYKIQKRSELQAEIGIIKEDLEIKREENEERKAHFDQNSQEYADKARKYRELRTQQRILNEGKLNYSVTFASNFGAKGISLDFITSKALERIEEELEAIKGTEIGEYLFTLDEIKDIEEKLYEKEETLSNMPKYVSHKNSLVSKLEKLNQIKTTQQLELELANLVKRREELQEKFRYANIENERRSLIAKISELSELLQGLLKQEG